TEDEAGVRAEHPAEARPRGVEPEQRDEVAPQLPTLRTRGRHPDNLSLDQLTRPQATHPQELFGSDPCTPVDRSSESERPGAAGGGSGHEWILGSPPVTSKRRVSLQAARAIAPG